MDERTPRQAGWTESVAVGCKDFVEKVKEMLGGRACGRRIHEVSKTGSCALKTQANLGHSPGETQ